MPQVAIDQEATLSTIGQEATQRKNGSYVRGLPINFNRVFGMDY